MPKWTPPQRGSETWTWVDDAGHPLATAYPDGDLWVARSVAAGVVGKSRDRRGATAMLSYDRLTGTAQRSVAHGRRRGAAQRAVAIRTLGFDPEAPNAPYEHQYAGTTGELTSWAREKKTAAQLDAEVEAYLLEQEHGEGRESATSAPRPSLTVRQINSITRAADGRNIYLIRRRMDEETVQRITRARTRGRETEVRVLATGNWLPVLPERGDRLEVR